MVVNKIRSNGGYVPALDGIRAIAILLVLGLHAGMPFMVGGYIGVDIFFFLSGFLITTLLIREYATKHRINLKNFYVRRILRLLPALIFFLLVLTYMKYFF